MPEIIKHLRAVFDNQKLLVYKLSFLFIYFCLIHFGSNPICIKPQLSGWAEEIPFMVKHLRNMKDRLVR